MSTSPVYCLKDIWGGGNEKEKAFGSSISMKSTTVNSGQEKKTKKLVSLHVEVYFSLFLQSHHYSWYSGSSRSLHVALHSSPFPCGVCHSDVSEHREWDHPENATAGTVPLSELSRVSSRFIAFQGDTSNYLFV